MSTDLRPAVALFERFGVDATVTPAGGAPVDCIVIPDSGRPHRFESDPDVSAQAATFDVPKDAVPSLPPGSTIVAPRTLGGVVETWRCIRVDDRDSEYSLAVVEVAQ